ncbi:MAG: CbiX/SirB N-terminal domain-containing protein [Verrucomicrobiota bacterium]
MSRPAIFLIDNGSLRPEATFGLRDLAANLTARVGAPVEAVSLLHSYKIPVEKLAGVPATVVKSRLRELLQEGQTDFVLLPLFLGPSLAVIDFLPLVLREFKEEFPELQATIAEPLAGMDVENPDPRLARMLADHVRAQLENSPDAQVSLIDHGTPIEPVNRLRNAVARQLAQELGQTVQPCSMERRDGPEYAFNEPLLEHLGEIEGFSARTLILAMFFLLPGRHAGAGGDVAEIAEGVIDQGIFHEVKMTPLLGEHPLLLEILEERLMAACPLPATI